MTCLTLCLNFTIVDHCKAPLHYITLHYITLHYITLHYITLHYITLHYITLHYITLHYMRILSTENNCYSFLNKSLFLRYRSMRGCR